MAKYALIDPMFGLVPGTLLYDYNGHTYGLVREDEAETVVPHVAVTQDSNGGVPFYSVPLDSLALLPASVDKIKEYDR